VVLELFEPTSRAKLWIKHIELSPVTATVDFTNAHKQTPQGQQLIKVISPNSITALLNTFYSPTLQKMWDQLDTQEIQNLKGDIAKIKGKTQFRAN
jgi:hypothetical protein